MEKINKKESFPIVAERKKRKMNCYVIKVEKGAFVIGSSMEFMWKESVQPTKGQMIQKAIQHLVKKNASSGQYSVYYNNEDVIFNFVKRV